MTISSGNAGRPMEERIVRKEAMESISKNSEVCRFTPNYAVCRRMMRKYPVRFGGGPMEKCHIQLLRYNELWKLASGLPDHDVVVLDEAGRRVASRRFVHT